MTVQVGDPLNVSDVGEVVSGTFSGTKPCKNLLGFSIVFLG
jgi:hypothetical protein